jgi:LCP family protein required for cell wall assembly
MIVPGWGQLSTGSRLVGKTLVFCTGLAAIGVLTTFLFVEPEEMAVWLTDPDVILVFVVCNVIIAVVRVASTEHAWRAAGGKAILATLVLAAVVAGPHVAIAWVGLEARDSLVKIFPETPSPVTAPAPATTTTTRPIDLSPIVAAPGQYDDDAIEVARSEPWRPFGENRLNILLLGGDAGPGRGGLRTDTMIVVSADPVSGDVALFGLPRNFGGITLTDGSAVPVRRLNHVYWWGHRQPERFDGVDPGATAVADAVANITGLEIDHFALVDLTGFADLIDVLGGVTVDVARTVNGPLYDEVTGGYEMIVIEPGPQTLDGARALAYARARYGSSDYARMGRQRCILAAVAAQADPLAILANLKPLLEVVEENVTTDIPVETLPDLVRLMLLIDPVEMRLIGFDSSWSAGFTEDKHPIPDITRIREAVRATIEDRGEGDDFGVATAGEACA